MPSAQPDKRAHLTLPLLAAAGGIRAFAIGLTGVLLGLHLARLGMGAGELGLIVGAGLGGNAVATAILAWAPRQPGRRSVLVLTTALSAAGLLAVAFVSKVPWLAAIAFAGLLNGMGRDRGPAQVVEQSLLADRAGPDGGARTMVRYTATQDVLGGLGGLAAGLPDLLPGDPTVTTRFLFIGTALLTALSLACYLWLLPADPALTTGRRPAPPTRETRRRVRSLTALFTLDSLGGGALAGSILSWWFFQRFGLTGAVTGPLFLAARGLNALSYFGAEYLGRRIGLLRTMVYTHLPSSAFLLLLPWAPTPAIAIVLFLLREALVQMDVPARQAFIAAVTLPGERVYAYGVTGLARNAGWAVGPALAGWSVGALGLAAPLVLGASLKIVYDLLLLRSFQAHHAAGSLTGGSSGS